MGPSRLLRGCISGNVGYKRGVTHRWNHFKTMAGAMHKWTEQDTLTLIKVRVQNDNLFTGRRHTAKKALEEILKALILTQIGKKWDSLKRKYKELRCPPTGSGTDRGEATAATWPYFTAMHEAIGGRPSIDPPTLMDSATAALASGSGSTYTEAVQSQATVEDEEATESGLDSQEDVEPSTSAGPPPRQKKKSALLQFLEAEAVKEEDRFNRQQAASEEASAKFLKLFEEVVSKE
ncbi:uncharacterized protein LOC117538309 [Gymnodraco acuticeps]|uniref:Uncharacterized protein LOC117538309 n=1 Tax=Gymnodraco acuticeps TaxID=8218 RepID=A0A6P8T811_GYMAC|nr:uncharacterized protein LOC117538309 [Gymnodraco acuticeps]